MARVLHELEKQHQTALEERSQYSTSITELDERGVEVTAEEDFAAERRAYEAKTAALQQQHEELDAEWAKRIIAQVGNYGEIFERNIGVNTPLGIERGVNALWTNGGLQYSPPFR